MSDPRPTSESGPPPAPLADPAPTSTDARAIMLPTLSVVVPVRDAEAIVEECLLSVVRQGPAAIILVDGRSTDGTVEIARRFVDVIVSDEGRGLPAARSIGARTATTPLVALVDADVILQDGSLAALLAEFERDGYMALQAGLLSESGPGYWGQALAEHHRTGRSRYWFGLVATIFEREALLQYGFDASFGSGEDIELRWRLAHAGAKAGVSRQVIVRHRFGDTFAFARGQFRADGHGLALMVRKHGWRGARLLLLPAAAGARGVLLSLLRRQPRWIPYYCAFSVFNYAAMLGELFRRPRG